MKNEEKLELFKNELGQLSNANLRSFVEKILIETGDWFYHDAASTSGKYHPQYALGDGGLVRHTRAVVYWLWQLYRSELFNVNEHQIQLLTVGAIAHDIRKHTSDGGYVATHARAASNLILEEQAANPDKLTAEDADYISKAIATHMGIWGKKDGEKAPESDSEKILHLADLMASRREVSIDFLCNTAASGETQVVNVLPKVDTSKTIENYIFDFGKFSGKTLDEAYKEDKSYLDWIKNKEDFGHTEAKKLIIEFLEKKK